ncbi:MAG: sulfite exporter TauE/SafE family protein [candidate division Zixibacteria bacterium]|nr:sulfite exporter TauE/SafE family protein [candidate division Zixibacteria bacterium]
MESLHLAAASALWLGILTSISPCPLATNIAAVSYISKQVDSSRRALWTGLLYVLGRLITYVAVGAVVTAGVLSIPGVSNFLQKYMNSLLGPILILAGLILLGWLPFNIPGFTASDKMTERASRSSLWGACVLGALFALSFCPVSAALFIGSPAPLSVQRHLYLLLPSLYGIGTRLPVLAFGIVIAVSTQSVAKLFRHLTEVERWVRVITALVFIVIGIYMIMRYVFYLF